MIDTGTAQTLRYTVVEGWEQLPANFTHLDCVGIGVDAQDNVYLLTRDQSRVIVYDRSGKFLRSWGEDLFTPRTHGLTIGPDGTVFIVDEGINCVYRFNQNGEQIGTIGTPGGPSDTGYDGTLESIRGGPPFNRPTNLAVAPNGDLYITDGYGNCKVHRFSADGKLIQSWGERGTGPGQFNLVHGAAVTADGRVLIADRENDRIQIFTADGKFIEQWTHVQRPTNVRIDAAGRIYVSELWWRDGQVSQRHGVISPERPGSACVLAPDGTLLARFGASTAERSAAGNFVAPHDICVDSHGDIYVAEVTETFGVRPGLVATGTHTFQKFRLETSSARRLS